MVCSIEDADPNYDLGLSDNLNILGSHDTKVSEPGPSWPSFVFNTLTLRSPVQQEKTTNTICYEGVSKSFEPQAFSPFR